MIIALALAVQAPVPCGTLPPAFHAPIVCPPFVLKNGDEK